MKMTFKPSMNLSPFLKQQIRYTQAAYRYGPQVMNITQPLSRASTVAEITMNMKRRQQQQQQQQQQKQQQRHFGYYYPFPKIPRPKRNVLYYSTWTKGRQLLPSRKRLRLPSIRLSKRLFSTANQKIKSKTWNLHNRFFSTEARVKRRQRRRFIRWWTITSLTIVLGGVAAKIRYERGEGSEVGNGARPQSWQVAYSSLPLKSLSRLWGQVNSINLPVWLRSPSYKLYSALFGVNMDEMEEPDLTKFKNLSEFFYRKLKPGARPIADSEVVSPADGKVLKCGIIHNGQIEQVKGVTYSIDALLGSNIDRLAAPSHSLDFHGERDDEVLLRRHEEFAKINGISYSLDDLLGGENDNTYHINNMNYQDKGDGTAIGSKSSTSKELSVAKKVVVPGTDILKSSQNKQLYFAVIYLAPGDYHRYHSPTSWVTTLRRHFVGELFSVAPFFQKTLQGLFVLNERVALLGYWKHGFFSMIPVGATNVGSIVVNFDKDLKTNDVYEHEMYLRSAASVDENTPLLSSSSSDESTNVSSDESTDVSTDVSTISLASSMKSARKRLKKNTVYEATYTRASRLLGGYPLIKGQEVGGFKLGSTVVLVFEAPDNFTFSVKSGEKVKVGQSLGEFQ